MSQEVLPTAFNFRCCLFCYGHISTLVDEIPFLPHISHIVSSCRKYLPKEIGGTININFSVDVIPFCRECSENVNQLSKLDIQIEEIRNQISQLVNRFSERVFRDRKAYEVKQCGTTYLQNDGFPTFPTEAHTVWNNQEDILLNKEQCDNTSSLALDGNPVIANAFPEDFSSTGLSDNDLDKSDIELEDSLDRQTYTGAGNKQERNKTQTKVIKTTVTSSDLQLQKGNSGFVCPNCHKKFTRLDILQRHQCGTKTYECETCGKSFSSQGSLKLHVKSHTGEKPHKCDTCGKCFGLPHHLRLHIRMHTGERPYECEFCKKRFKDIGYLAKHKLQHSNIESERRKYSCEVCSKSFTLYSTLKKHLVSQHTGDTPHKCPICGKAFGSSTDLRHHHVVHTKEKAFKCKLCSKCYTRSDTLKEHMLCHGEDKKYQCEKCGKSYYNRSALMNHNTLKHSDDGVFICDICGNSYKNELILKIHRRCHLKKSENQEKFKCLVCERTYNKSYDLLRHQRDSHYVTTVDHVTCEKCAMEFQDYATYDRHRKRKLSRYKCTICIESFTSRCEMALHFKEKHSKLELPYKCRNCNTRFISMGELSLHKTRECVKDEPTDVKVTRKILKRKRKSTVSKRTRRAKPAKVNLSKTEAKGKSKAKNFDTIRRQSRPRNAKMRNKVIVDSENESDDEGSGIHKENYSDNEILPEKIKTEPDDWIKQELEVEVDDFSD